MAKITPRALGGMRALYFAEIWAFASLRSYWVSGRSGRKKIVSEVLTRRDIGSVQLDAIQSGGSLSISDTILFVIIH